MAKPPRPKYKKYTSVVVCLNCGERCSGKYCPHCGQPTDTARLTKKTFAQHSINGILRVNGNFFRTAKMLLLAPWTLISDYLKGKRVQYTSPLVMLVLLVFYDTVFRSWLGLDGIDHEEITDIVEGVDIYSILKVLVGNESITAILATPPAVIALRYAYRHAGSHRFNWVEYMFAGIYFWCLLYVLDILLTPIEYFGFEDIDYISVCYICVMALITMWKAFPCRIVKWIRRTIVATIVTLLLCLVYTVILVLLVIGIAFLIKTCAI